MLAKSNFLLACIILFTSFPSFAAKVRARVVKDVAVMLRFNCHTGRVSVDDRQMAVKVIFDEKFSPIEFKVSNGPYDYILNEGGQVVLSRPGWRWYSSRIRLTVGTPDLASACEKTPTAVRQYDYVTIKRAPQVSLYYLMHSDGVCETKGDRFEVRSADVFGIATGLFPYQINFLNYNSVEYPEQAACLADWPE